MINITLIVLGKLKEKYLTMACDEYIKRLSALCKLNIIELSPVSLPDNPNETQIEQALENESKDISSKIPKNSKIVTMCIEGKGMSSKKFSEYFDNLALLGNSNITFIIGSSYGLSSKIKNMSDLKLSMSEMTFPHQLARVMLLEQIYRALMISSGRKYDK
ncbi:MAG: 23S rRNA (pseudouridine(1915)-N(3))-methyltransferase RlmH [Clostridia bacterium]|nr:23S rRNA (pseudouridine(1915)-N(3))-methyltransferase RlmH [Clostridia bacterium]